VKFIALCHIVLFVMSEKKIKKSQLEFDFPRDHEPDRNFHRGGRSFYFFDLDDNVFTLSTQIYLFNKDSREELPVSTGEFARIHSLLGKPGDYENYEVSFCEETGSFRRFRDWSQVRLEKLMQSEQPFIEDIQDALGQHELHWKGPSWSFFYHAVFNQRPISIITARGHQRETMKRGVWLLCQQGHLAFEPNYMGIYPLSNNDVRRELGDLELSASIPELKKRAIIESVEKAMRIYGKNEHHRFGMSDDDPKNIELIIDAMRVLKKKYPDNSFYVIDSRDNELKKEEIFLDHLEVEKIGVEQLRLI